MDIPALVIGSVALFLTLLQGGYAAWRRFVRRPKFKLQYAVAPIERQPRPLRIFSDLTGGAFFQDLMLPADHVALKKVVLSVIALGGGRPETIVDSSLEVHAAEGFIVTGAPAKEMIGDSGILVPADRSTKFRLTFTGELRVAPDDELRCRLLLDTGRHQHIISFKLEMPIIGNEYQYHRYPLSGYQRPGILEALKTVIRRARSRFHRQD